MASKKKASSRQAKQPSATQAGLERVTALESEAKRASLALAASAADLPPDASRQDAWALSSICAKHVSSNSDYLDPGVRAGIANLVKNFPDNIDWAQLFRPNFRAVVATVVAASPDLGLDKAMEEISRQPASRDTSYRVEALLEAVKDKSALKRHEKTLMRKGPVGWCLSYLEAAEERTADSIQAVVDRIIRGVETADNDFYYAFQYACRICADLGKKDPRVPVREICQVVASRNLSQALHLVKEAPFPGSAEVLQPFVLKSDSVHVIAQFCRSNPGCDRAALRARVKEILEPDPDAYIDSILDGRGPGMMWGPEPMGWGWMIPPMVRRIR